ncbi:SusC/RagA family TonB-linked outer membrane protein [Ferruginibacter yonginensis]|uniref:SusC/RagA family TonB-linked outer membrane protein n=1 Tax=Ferruginibacter yonginensis TaxID=1310416 RepID=A0ABV8QMC9_9BACT
MRKRILLFTFFVFATVLSFAQTKTIKGKVTDENGNPLSGVSVLQKGSTKGTKTDADGNYTIETSNDVKSLVFSSVGQKSVTETIGNKTTINVTLQSNAVTGDEVVVIGYQTIKRKDLTGSVSSVGAKQIKDIPVNSAAEALTGRLAGVQLTSTEGKPGSEVTIRVRGGGSITQDNAPLYIVDGVQVENALSVLSPQDIESVDVLKDASATAIYGARGSNGVVIITTKKGKNGKTIISYNGFYGIRQLPKKLSVLDPYEFVKYQYERSRRTADSTNFLRNYGTTWDTIKNFQNVPFIDWQDEMFGRNAKFTSHNISVSGGSAATQFNFGATSNKEEGVLLNNGFDRKLFNFSLDHQANNRLKVGVSTRYNITTVNGAGTSADGSSASTNRLRQSVKYRPLLIGQQDINDYDPAYAQETNGNSLSLVNPIAYNESEYRKNKTEVINISTYATLKLTNFLSFKTTFGYDITNGALNSFDDSLSNNSRLNGSNLPLASINTTKRITYNNSNVLTYTNGNQKTSFAKRNNITALLGQEIYDRTDKSQYIEARLFPSNTKPQYAFANMSLGTSVVGTPRTFEVTSRVASAFGRINYSRDNKYLLTLSARSDGSSKFSKENRYSFFPSGSFAWKISEEKFFSKIKSVVNDAKLRVSYGEAGNNRIPDYLYETVFVTGTTYGINNAGTIGLIPQTLLANPDLLWEKTISQNLGLDLSFLNNRINVTIDAYKNISKDLLLSVQIPVQSGYTNQIQNKGSTQNKGIEFQVVATPIQKKDFTWTSSFNISYNKNTVRSLGGANFFLQNSGWGLNSNPADYIVRVGDPVGSMYGYVTDGFYTLDDFNYNPTTQVYTLKAGVANNQAVTSVAPQPGTLKFKNLSGDSVIDATNDRTIIGNANPKYFGGFNQQFTYKNWDMSVFVNFQVGNDVYNANKLEFTSGYTPNSNLLSIVKDRWTNVDAQGNFVRDPATLAALNTNAKIWTPSTAAQSFVLHSWAVEKGSFLRINNISLGYTLPASFTKRASISRFRIYGTVNNLKVFTNYSGYDPEVSARRSSPVTPGVDYSAYPKSRSYIVGVNVSL